MLSTSRGEHTHDCGCYRLTRLVDVSALVNRYSNSIDKPVVCDVVDQVRSVTISRALTSLLTKSVVAPGCSATSAEIHPAGDYIRDAR